MLIDLRQIPFSRYGSYTAFSHMGAKQELPEGLYLRSMRSFEARIPRETFRLELLTDSGTIPCTETCSQSMLRMSSEQGVVEICLPAPNLIRIRGSGGVGLRLTFSAMRMFEHAIESGGKVIVNCRVSQTHFSFGMLHGDCNLDAPWKTKRSEYIVIDLIPDPTDHVFETSIEEYTAVPTDPDCSETFDECVVGIEQEFAAWMETMPSVALPYVSAQELAGYINWSSVVEPHGALKRPGMYMSKKGMVAIWSWDHCFNALALVYGNPSLAWDQLMIPFDMQDESGLLPDRMTERGGIFNFCKPPVHGWTLLRMLEASDKITTEQLEKIYEPLSRWTAWWFDHRDDDSDGIPQYNHGNDSGWDNATVFDVGVPLESPDLPAFLVIQMEALALIATRLGRPDEAAIWKQEMTALLERFIDHSWRESSFVAMRSGSHEMPDKNRDSLLVYLPLLLGKRLPEEIRRKLVDALKQSGRFLTDYGIATESPSSPQYDKDGYWRGPIWAPSTMLLVDGLAACGEVELARTIARRFCDTAANNNFAENFDALTGEARRDRPYTWTSSVFLILAHEYLS